MGCISFKNVAFKYSESDAFAISDINCDISAGEIVGITGKNASGKSTLLRLIKPSVAPIGELFGVLEVDGVNVNDMTLLESATKIGYVGSNTDLQIVCDNVLQELVFGLECIGLDADCMQSRLAEISAYFGLNDLQHVDICELSGGQKQILNLASVMIMRPSVLLLDEPTAELDPIAAERFISLVVKLNIELGTTIVLVEHNLKRVLPFVDRLILLEDGNIVSEGNAEEVYKSLHFDCTTPDTANHETNQTDNKIAYEGKGLWYRYSRGSCDVLCEANISQTSNSIYSIVGANGCGKSTLLRILCGVCKPYRGKVSIYEDKILKRSNLDNICKVALLPQNPQLLFSNENILDDILPPECCPDKTENDLAHLANLFGIEDILSSSSHIVSRGQLQRAALVKLLLLNPTILLFDEPTLGLDLWCKQELGQFLQAIAEQGTTILMATHDIDFAVNYSDKVAWMFDGEVLSFQDAKKFTSGNFFYR